MQSTVTDKKLFGKTILVAEDVEMNQQLIRYILESSGAQVVIAKNGVEALDQVKSKIFDCVIMDVQMPEMDGVQATVKIRALQNPALSAIPIIALTANCQPDDLMRYEQAGMDDYLSKPFVEAQLVEAILNSTGRTKEELPASTTSNVNRLYDLTMIRSVSGGDQAFIRKMILLFIETVPQNVQELVAAMGQHNWEQVSKMAHKLKSTIDSMGIKTLHEQIRTVEGNAKKQEGLDKIPAMVQEVETVVADCIRQLYAEVQ